MVTGLSVGGGAEVLTSGIFYSSGCVPHACGLSNAFMAVDAKGQKLYFAQQQDNAPPAAWPALDGWPAEVKAVMTSELAPL